MKIKICGLTRLEDALVAVQSGADALGFVFAPSKRQISELQAKKLFQQLPPTVLTIGVFVDQDPQWIRHLVDSLGLDRVQLHGHESAAVQKKFPKNRVIKALRPKPGIPLPPKDPVPDAAALLVDAYVAGVPGGTGQLANWSFAKHLKKFKKPLILSGGLNSMNVEEAIKKVKPEMVDVSSSVESSPGIKNPAKIKAFIKAVRSCS